MTFTLIYAIVVLLLLLAVFIVTYRLRGLKWAIVITILAFIALFVCYVSLVMFATSQM